MKLAPRQLDAFLKAPTVPCILLYGPDSGLVRERAEALTRRVAGDVSDPFRVAEIPAAALRDDPARLADEANALSMTGGRRVVRLRDAGDAQTEIIGAFLAGPPPAALVLIEAGDLGRKSSLRLLFESAKTGVALPCYRDEGESLARLVDDVLGAAGLRPASEARRFLLEHLGNDRGVSRGELDKLVLYMAGRGPRVELEDVVACIGDSAATSLDDVAFAVGDGDIAALDRAIDRGLQDGATSVGILRAVARHFLRLHQTKAAMTAGGDLTRLVNSLRPPIYFRLVGRFQVQVQRWSEEALAAGIRRLLEAEIACKSTGAPDEALMRRACMDIARLVSTSGRRA